MAEEEESEESESRWTPPSPSPPPRTMMSLREWVDSSSSFHPRSMSIPRIFRQIVAIVDGAHRKGFTVHNVRPSCFLLLLSGSDDDDDEEEVRFDNFPFKSSRVLEMETKWYTTPEEEEEEKVERTSSSDVYRLGVLLFELLLLSETYSEKVRAMANLRHRVLPPQMLLKSPKEASFCLWLLHPHPSSRPTLTEILKSEFLNEPQNNVLEREAAIKLSQEIEDHELLLEFLSRLQKEKHKNADNLHGMICCLSSDIEEVEAKQLAFRKVNLLPDLERDEVSGLEREDQCLTCPGRNDDSESSVCRKRFRQGHFDRSKNDDNCQLNEETKTDDSHATSSNDISSKSSRLMKNFKKLEAAYFLTRYKSKKPEDKCPSNARQASTIGRGSTVKTEASSVDNLNYKAKHCGGEKSGWLSPFPDGLCKYLSYSSLKVRADLKQGDLFNSCNLVCSLGFDRDKKLFATAGVNRKIKIFECDTILNEDCDIHYPLVEMVGRSKFSGVCWNSYIKSHLASSNFDGVVQVWDVTRSQVLLEMREHERRVWSLDFSLVEPTKLASGSDDGTVKLWNINQVGSVGTIETKANVCSVQFPPNSGQTIAIGSADHSIYCYDMRNLRAPWCTLVGHTKTVSYVKFVDSSTLVSSSTDNSLKLWDLTSSGSGIIDNPLQTFTGHTNIKNFVGLSVSGGYIATGSETNEVFVYHKAFPMPVLSFKFNSSDPISGLAVDDSMQFISSVCWRGHSSTLIAANSSGNIKILEMV